jgi:hypothetical protein
MAIGTVTFSYTFGPLSGQIPLSYLDTNYSQIGAAHNNLVGSANLWPYVQSCVSAAAAISTTSSFIFDPSVHGQDCEITVTNAITITLAAATGKIVVGTMYTLTFKAGDTSARAFAKGATVLAPGATLPIVSGSVTPGGRDVFHLRGVDANTVMIVGSSADVR